MASIALEPLRRADLSLQPCKLSTRLHVRSFLPTGTSSYDWQTGIGGAASPYVAYMMRRCLHCYI